MDMNNLNKRKRQEGNEKEDDEGGPSSGFRQFAMAQRLDEAFSSPGMFLDHEQSAAVPIVMECLFLS